MKGKLSPQDEGKCTHFPPEIHLVFILMYDNCICNNNNDNFLFVFQQHVEVSGIYCSSCGSHH